MDRVIIEAKSISYGEVFSNVDLNIKESKTYLILGDNGSGKTTLLYLIQGLLKPDSGELLYKGQPYSYSKKWLNNLRYKVGLLFQNPDYQIIGLTVKDDVAIALRCLGMEKNNIKEHVEKLLKGYKLHHLKDRRTDLLSFGEKKKVSMASIAALTPDVTLLDEPYAGLDREGKAFVDSYIANSKQSGKTVVVTSHEVGEFIKFVDNIYVISDKKLVQLSKDNLDILPHLQRNLLILSKYGYMEKPIPEELFLGVAR
ncbi:MAG: energy-coupling factor ABC transporter ATP-binding protein [Calditerrivibrio sp.]|nr:energy-coupling factor ABC transporter ATP-binding protein [Calditerrivibrio sp.]